MLSVTGKPDEVWFECSTWNVRHDGGRSASVGGKGAIAGNGIVTGVNVRLTIGNEERMVT